MVSGGVSARVVRHVPGTPPPLAHLRAGGVGSSEKSPGYDPAVKHSLPSEAKKLAEDDIWHASRRGDAAAVERFVRGGAVVSALDEAGRTPAYYATLYGHERLGSLLRDYEAREALGERVAGEGEPPAKGTHLASSTQRQERRPPRAPERDDSGPAVREAGSSGKEGDGAGGGKAASDDAPKQRGHLRDARDGESLLESHHQAARDRAAIRRRRLRALERQQLFEDMEERKTRWLKLRKLNRGFEFSRAQKKELKRWFDFIDADGSGEINVEELQDPLLSTGIARNTAELQALIEAVDTDGSGEIGFDEFLAVLKPRSKDAPEPRRRRQRGGVAAQSSGRGRAAQAKKAPEVAESNDDKTQAFKVLQEQLNDEKSQLPLQMMITIQRRKFLLNTIVGNPAEDEKARRELERAEEEASRTNNPYKLAQVRRKQRERDQERAKRTERLLALQQVVDRNKRRAAEEEAVRNEQSALEAQAKREAVEKKADAAAASGGRKGRRDNRDSGRGFGASGAREITRPGMAGVELSDADKKRLQELKDIRDARSKKDELPPHLRRAAGKPRRGASPGHAQAGAKAGDKSDSSVRLAKLNAGSGMQYNPRAPPEVRRRRAASSADKE